MRSPRLALAGGLLAFAACSTDPAPSDSDGSDALDPPAFADAPIAVLRPRGSQAVTRAMPSAAAYPISYHGGPVLHNQKVVAIYWASTPIYKNGPTPGTTGAGTADGSLVGYFLRNLGGSGYFNINTTYYDLNGAKLPRFVTNTLSYTQFWADNTDVPSSSGSTISESAIRDEIVKGFSSGRIGWDANTIYLVFTAGKTNLGGDFPAEYCGYHSSFLIGGIGPRVYYAAMPYVNSYPSACTPRKTSPNSDAAADAEVTVLAHEIEETVTDPLGNAWYFVTLPGVPMYENADRCLDWVNWGTTYSTSNGGVANMKIGTKDFLVQQNWVSGSVQACALAYP